MFYSIKYVLSSLFACIIMVYNMDDPGFSVNMPETISPQDKNILVTEEDDIGKDTTILPVFEGPAVNKEPDTILLLKSPDTGNSPLNFVPFLIDRFTVI